MHVDEEEESAVTIEEPSDVKDEESKDIKSGSEPEPSCTDDQIPDEPPKPQFNLDAFIEKHQIEKNLVNRLSKILKDFKKKAYDSKQALEKSMKVFKTKLGEDKATALIEELWSLKDELERYEKLSGKELELIL